MILNDETFRGCGCKKNKPKPATNTTNTNTTTTEPLKHSGHITWYQRKLALR